MWFHHGPSFGEYYLAYVRKNKLWCSKRFGIYVSNRNTNSSLTRSRVRRYIDHFLRALEKHDTAGLRLDDRDPGQHIRCRYFPQRNLSERPGFTARSSYRFRERQHETSNRKYILKSAPDHIARNARG